MYIKCKILIYSLLFFFFSSGFLYGADFKLYPSGGSINEGEEFHIDVLVDTYGEEVILARMVINFDSSLIQLRDAQRDEDIFCDWPEEEQLIDNGFGKVMATGFCKNPSYSTSGEEDVFIRLTFVALKQGDLTLEFEYSGRDEPSYSVMMQDGSPPQNILSSPESYSYSILPTTSSEEQTQDSPVVSDGTPDTSLYYIYPLILGLLLVLLGTYLFSCPIFKRERFMKIFYGGDKKRKH